MSLDRSKLKKLRELGNGGCQAQCPACAETGNAGGACDPSSERCQLLQKDKQRQECDPKYIHHAAHKQKRH